MSNIIRVISNRIEDRGMSITVVSRYIPTEQSNLNFCNNGTINSDFLLYLNGEFSHRFKEEIKQLHKEKQ